MASVLTFYRFFRPLVPFVTGGLGLAQPAFRTGAAGRAQAACRAAVFFCPAGREPFLGP